MTPYDSTIGEEIAFKLSTGCDLTKAAMDLGYDPNQIKRWFFYEEDFRKLCHYAFVLAAHECTAKSLDIAKNINPNHDKTKLSQDKFIARHFLSTSIKMMQLSKMLIVKTKKQSLIQNQSKPFELDRVNLGEQEIEVRRLYKQQKYESGFTPDNPN
ncbi:MAG: hypothetical protein K1X44_00930, partial [Alphaproteobacteria bacterium]|nr:hypothetical protein [Alphaproteobacteria bacterium]